MAHLLRMPGVSADAEEVIFLEWSVSPGTTIADGDSIALVETEKANLDIISDQAAVLWRSLIDPGAVVKIGEPIAILIGLDEKISDEAALLKSLGLTGAVSAAPATSTPPSAPLVTEVKSTFATNNGNGARIFSSPIARKLAKENNIAVENIVGTGPNQRIVRADVERSILSSPSNSEVKATQNGSAVTKTNTYTDIPHSGMRRAVARALSASKQQAPHFYLNTTCRVDALLALRKSINEDGSVKVSINDFIFKAVVKALVAVPEMNVIWMDDCVRRFDSVDVAVAIGSTRGLVTPVIRSAENLSLTQISNQIQDFAKRANEGNLKQTEIEGGSFCVSNLGMYGVESFSAILNPPQVGILAVGAAISEPVVVAGAVEIANTIKMTLSVDHRPVDGVMAAQWLQLFKTLIENPALILA
ncbi:MAG: dihydrolipoamide acetyltransferase family protein [Candidatus Nanopelagicales bacterium]